MVLQYSWWFFVEPQSLLKNHLRTIIFVCVSRASPSDVIHSLFSSFFPIFLITLASGRAAHVSPSTPRPLPAIADPSSSCLRSLRSATPPRPRSWATRPATSSSPAWCLPTPTRPRPWWTSSKPWAGTTSPRWPPRATTERAAWTPSSRYPEKQVEFPAATLRDYCMNQSRVVPPHWKTKMGNRKIL